MIVILRADLVRPIEDSGPAGKNPSASTTHCASTQPGTCHSGSDSGGMPAFVGAGLAPPGTGVILNSGPPRRAMPERSKIQALPERIPLSVQGRVAHLAQHGCHSEGRPGRPKESLRLYNALRQPHDHTLADHPQMCQGEVARPGGRFQNSATGRSCCRSFKLRLT